VTPHSKSRHAPARVVSAFLAVLASALVALTLSSTASAATPCGQKVLADWFDNGRIDRLYPLHCYEEAIDAIPADIRDYANAEQVISRALQLALRGELDPVGGPDPTPGNDSGGAGGGGSGSGGSSGSGGESGVGTGPEAAPAVDTSGPSSIPIPLIVLGGMSLALLAAGALGYASRRRQAAREHLDDGDDDSTLV
jgi:hypothetical protein